MEAFDLSNVNISSVSLLVWSTYFWGVIPTYGVLPYAMMSYSTTGNDCLRVLESVQHNVRKYHCMYNCILSIQYIYNSMNETERYHLPVLAVYTPMYMVCKTRLASGIIQL